MIEILTGRAWKFGDDINTDLLAPGVYMKGSLKELASHCLNQLIPYLLDRLNLMILLSQVETLDWDPAANRLPLS